MYCVHIVCTTYMYVVGYFDPAADGVALPPALQASLGILESVCIIFVTVYGLSVGKAFTFTTLCRDCESLIGGTLEVAFEAHGCCIELTCA